MAEKSAEMDRKAKELMEETDSDSRTRVYTGWMEMALTVVLAGFALFQLWANLTGRLGAVKLRTAHVLFLLPLCFLLYPAYGRERAPRRLPPLWDVLLCAAAVFCFGYIFRRYDALAKTGRLNTRTSGWGSCA